jgi:hypothetical protein
MPLAEKSLFASFSDYYKAFWFESRFVFVGEADCPVRLRLTCRLPNYGLPEGTIEIYLNGKRIGEALVDSSWGTWDIEVSGEVVVSGLNEVLIRWPLPEFPGKKALDDVAEDLVNEIYPGFFPLFGEIHSFTASDGRKGLSHS